MLRIAVLSAAAAALLVAPASARPADQDHQVSDLLNCAPQTYEAALDCLDKALLPENKQALIADDHADIRHGLGMTLRIGWGLWQDGPLSRSLVALGLSGDGEVRTEFLLDAFVARLRGEPFDAAARAKSYRNPAAMGQHSGDGQ